MRKRLMVVLTATLIGSAPLPSGLAFAQSASGDPLPQLPLTQLQNDEFATAYARVGGGRGGGRSGGFIVLRGCMQAASTAPASVAQAGYRTVAAVRRPGGYRPVAAYRPAAGYRPGYAYRPGYGYRPGYAYRPGYRYPYYAARPYYGGGYYYDYGGAAAAGAVGLATGAIVGGAIASQNQANTASAYCAQRFRSYNPATGTYVGYDGRVHSCP